jgi:hypothetical protein
MMRRGLSLLHDGVTSQTVRREVQRIASDLVDEGLVWKEAIDFVKDRIGGGVAVVFSTTNYHEGALGFLHALWQKSWIQQAELEKIRLSGSRIDWRSRNVVHFNMSSNKVIGLSDVLRIDEEVLKARISFVFGDDPLGNDRGLLEIARYPYVITNETNRHLNLPDRSRLVTWSEARAMSISELASLHTGSSEK